MVLIMNDDDDDDADEHDYEEDGGADGDDGNDEDDHDDYDEDKGDGDADHVVFMLTVIYTVSTVEKCQNDTCHLRSSITNVGC
eukprot:5251289-Karenia_brevis.AAC.1